MSILMICSVQGAILYLQVVLIRKDATMFDRQWFYWVVSLFIAVAIQMFSLLYKQVRVEVFKQIHI